MKGAITITLPEDVESALEEATREEGLSSDELIKKAVADYLFVRKFRLLRERMMAETEKAYTDQDVFDLIS
jgi:metal-responsive CopG/Arc/MetJ family transcriptional regulator